jgi:mannitol/fructose-specific phosphotransferase system IIA component (Ntr-type)
MIENCTIPFVEITNFLDDNDYLKIGRFLKEIEQADFEKYFFQSLFEESIFITDIKEKTPQKIISKMGNRLVEVGHVSPSFIDAALTREKTMATDIGNLVAIPHALSYGRKSSIAVGLLNDAVDWGNEKVKIVFLLNIRYKDIERMKSIFSYFYDLVQSKKKINQLIDTKQFDMFIQILKKGEI